MTNKLLNSIQTMSVNFEIILRYNNFESHEDVYYSTRKIFLDILAILCKLGIQRCILIETIG